MRKSKITKRLISKVAKVLRAKHGEQGSDEYAELVLTQLESAVSPKLIADLWNNPWIFRKVMSDGFAGNRWRLPPVE